ncbi:MAG: hypothetical protein SVW57_00665 [Thermodesulfobacteriota bacterium]|nr:hypothetical protein [Thermodesulfobacteriota bacterium]
MEYTHTHLDEEVELFCGSYTIDTENRLSYNGKEVLYLIGGTGSILSCCGTSCGLRYIAVPGYVKSWRHKKNEKGFFVSEIELIRAETEKQEIRTILKDKHELDSIEFW